MGFAQPEGGKDGRLGLAISGGGYRSALFGLGALHYLADSERIRELDTITSVSGGSYVNARALLYKHNLQGIGDSDFLEHFRPFVEAIVSRSPWTRLSVVAMGTVLALSLLVVLGVWDFAWWWRLLAGVVGLIFIPWSGRVLARSIWKTLFKSYTPSPPLGDRITPDMVAPRGGRVRRKIPSSTVDDNTVHHVFCCTDLHYARFTYLSNQLVYNSRLGHGSPGDFTVKTAVDASAAIPPIFAPLVLKTDGFLQLPPDSPARLLCADGGIYDTLATEWFTKDAEEMPDLHLRDLEPSTRNLPDRVLVLDGSAPVRGADHVPKTTVVFTRWLIPLVWWVFGHLRSAVLAFRNWDRRNLDDIRAGSPRIRGLLIKMHALSVEESPFSLNPSEKKEAALLQHKIDWGEVVKSNGSVPTWPTRLSPKQASELLYHGYAMAWTVLEDSNNPSPLPDPVQYRLGWLGS